MRLINRLLGAVAVFTASVFSWPAMGQPIALNIGYVPASDFVPLYIAKDKGLFEKRNIDATLTRIAVSSNIAAALVSNSVQIGMGTAPNLLQAAQGGLDLVIVSGAARNLRSNPVVSVVVKQGLKVSSAADLKGKKVGVPGIHSQLDILFKKWLLNNNVQLKDVTFIETPLGTMADLLAGGTLDAAIVLEPFRSRIIREKIGFKLADYVSELQEDVLSGFWMATGDWASKNRPTVQAFRDAWAEGVAYAIKNPEEARAVEFKYLNQNSPVPISYSLEVKPGDLEPYSKIMTDLGILRRPIDVNKLVFK